MCVWPPGGGVGFWTECLHLWCGFCVWLGLGLRLSLGLGLGLGLSPGLSLGLGLGLSPGLSLGLGLGLSPVGVGVGVGFGTDIWEFAPQRYPDLSLIILKYPTLSLIAKIFLGY